MHTTMTLNEFRSWYHGTFDPWMVLLVIVAAILLWIALRDEVKTTRRLPATALAVLLSGAVLAAEEFAVKADTCLSLEPYSALWWLLGCWNPWR